MVYMPSYPTSPRKSYLVRYDRLLPLEGYLGYLMFRDSST